MYAYATDAMKAARILQPIIKIESQINENYGNVLIHTYTHKLIICGISRKETVKVP